MDRLCEIKTVTSWSQSLCLHSRLLWAQETAGARWGGGRRGGEDSGYYNPLRTGRLLSRQAESMHLLKDFNRSQMFFRSNYNVVVRYYNAMGNSNFIPDSRFCFSEYQL